jgi:putative ABC transport system permease protein
MTITREIRYAARGLRKNAGFALVVILALGFGMGANAAIFSLMDQVLLRSLPVHDPSRLVVLDGPGAFRGRTFNRMTFSYPMYTDFRDRNEVFSGVLARFPTAMTLVWQGRSERVSGDVVSGNYFDILGVRPAIGRVFNASDDRTPGAHSVAVLSYGYWQRRFGGDRSVLGQTLVVNGHPMTIVGVSGQGFNGIQVGAASDVMVPMMMKAQMTPTWNDLDNRQSRWVTIVGRLKPGITADQAEVQLNVVYKQVNEQEILALTNVSEQFRQRFVTKHLEVIAILASIGVGLGLGGAFYLTRQVQSQLFGLSPHDPATLAGAVTILLSIALLAGFIPARRATTIDPLVALKAE